MVPRMLRSLELDASILPHLRTTFARLESRLTVAETLEAVRREPPTDRVVYLYVVDALGRLEGVVPIRALLFSAPERRIADLMIRRFVSLNSTATIREACEMFALYRLLALPVVDGDGRLQGIVDIELYTDELDALTDAEKRADLFQTLGVQASTETRTTALRAFVMRFPWLISNLVGGLICAVLAGRFQAELARVVALSMFIPVVLNLAESVSSQSVSLTLHLLRGQNPTRGLVASMLRQELVTGALLGAVCGASVALVALTWLGLGRVALCLLGGIGGGVAVAALLGMAIPLTLKAAALDPKIAAGPIALAAADVTTLFAYLGFARLLLS